MDTLSFAKKNIGDEVEAVELMGTYKEYEVFEPSLPTDDELCYTGFPIYILKKANGELSLCTDTVEIMEIMDKLVVI